jgi:hypothetical protein
MEAIEAFYEPVFDTSISIVKPKLQGRSTHDYRRIWDLGVEGKGDAVLNGQSIEWPQTAIGHQSLDCCKTRAEARRQLLDSKNWQQSAISIAVCHAQILTTR